MSDLPQFVSLGEALTDFVRTGTRTWQSAAGGSCWNVARSAAALGVSSAWAGAISADRFGDEIADESRLAGLDARFMQRVDKPPLIAMVHDTQPPAYQFLGDNAADLAFDPEVLPSGWIEAVRVAHFGCISLVRPGLGQRLVALAETLHRGGVAICFDPNMRNLMGPDYPALFERLAALASLIKLSDEDLTAIYPALTSDDALARVRKTAPEATVVYTRGAQGMTGYRADHAAWQPAFTVDTADGDSVGAGDACVGGLVAGLIERPEASLAEHLRLAAATAGAACCRTGAHAPSRQEVDALLAAHHAPRQFPGHNAS